MALEERRARILLLLSDPAAGVFYQDLLTSELRCTVVTSPDERAARTSLAKEPYDLFIADKPLSWIAGSGPLRWLIGDAIPRILLLRDPIEGREFKGIEFFPTAKPRTELVDRVRRMVGPDG